MKLVAWNMAHQTQERAIKVHFVDAVERMAPEVLALNEYVHGKTRAQIFEALAKQGLTRLEVSTAFGANNQVLIASRHALEPGELRGPPTADGGGESNFLHVKLADGLEVVGVRAPAYTQSALLHDYWRWSSAGRRARASAPPWSDPVPAFAHAAS